MISKNFTIGQHIVNDVKNNIPIQGTNPNRPIFHSTIALDDQVEHTSGRVGRVATIYLNQGNHFDMLINIVGNDSNNLPYQGSSDWPKDGEITMHRQGYFIVPFAGVYCFHAEGSFLQNTTSIHQWVAIEVNKSIKTLSQKVEAGNDTVSTTYIGQLEENDQVNMTYRGRPRDNSRTFNFFGYLL